MATVNGQVVCKESGLGVGGLVIEALDVPGVVDEERRADHPKTRRLASGITSGGGHFSLSFDANAERSINLLVTVSGPEDGERNSSQIFASANVRAQAAENESYVIHVSEEMLKKVGIKPPGLVDDGVKPADIAARRIVSAAEEDIQIADAEKTAVKLKLDRSAQIVKEFDDSFRGKIADRLTRVSKKLAASDTFVKQGASVEKAFQTLMAADLTNIINIGGEKAAVKVRFALTNGQHQTIKDALSGGKITRKKLRQILGPEAFSDATEYTAQSPLTVVGRAISDRQREAAANLGVTVPPPPPPPPTVMGTTDVLGASAAALQDGDIEKFLGRLTEDMTSPEEAILANLEPKATREGLTDRMKSLEFKPSPAEVCAFYDFNNLQVAFRHVWQEAIDEGILNLAETAYDEIVNAGGSPDPSAHRDPLKAISKAGELVYRAGRATRGKALAKGTSPTPSPSNSARWGVDDILGNIGDWVFSQGEASSGEQNDPLPDIITELNQRLKEPYAFTTFAANAQERSVNFGCLVTYRQHWCPMSYQAGRIAKTLTLAPKEVQRYSKTIRRKTKRAEKEVKNHLAIRKDEMSTTSRLEQEIVDKAQTKTHFEMSAEKSAPGGAGPSAKMSFSRDAQQNSDQSKKSFRESVIKAAQEFKDEFNVEVTTEEADEYESVESGELLNPNDELAVTFIFYELQRRYRVSERLHRLTPVVFVAQEMPAPHEINESWIMSHDWILRRVLLDDSFVPAIDYLCSRIVGDQVAIEEIKTNITQQRMILTELKQQLRITRERTATYRTILEKSMLVTAQRRHEGGGGSLLGDFISSIPGIGAAVELGDDIMEAAGDFFNPDQPNVGDNRLDSLKEAIQRSIEEERDMLMRVEREVTALNALTESYAKLRADNLNQRALVLRLRIHIKQNITYYMQAIWSHEPPDQRFLRLHETPIPKFSDQSEYDFGGFEALEDPLDAYAHLGVLGDEINPALIYEAEVLSNYTLEGEEALAKIAHLDEVKGYFGNYMMFALKDSNPLTEFMMEPYVLQGFGELTDPDDVGNWTLDEFAEYVTHLKANLSEDQFKSIKKQLSLQYARLLKTPLRDGEEIVVPTGSLFIEALPAGTSLLENLKRLQRTMEVKLAQEQVRAAALKNVRIADMLLNNDRSDPEVDKKVLIQGVGAGPTIPVDDPA